MAAGIAVFVHTSRQPEQVKPWLENHGLAATVDEVCGRCQGQGGRAEPSDTSPGAYDVEDPCVDCGGSGLLAFWNDSTRLLVSNRKLPAVAYIDDRAIRFESWYQALTDLEDFEGIVVS